MSISILYFFFKIIASFLIHMFCEKFDVNCHFMCDKNMMIFILNSGSVTKNSAGILLFNVLAIFTSYN